MALAGQRTTLNSLQASRRVDMASEIMLLEPESTPLTVFSKANKMKRKVAVNPEYSHVEDSLRTRLQRLNDATNLTAADTVFIVDDNSIYTIGDLVRVTRTGEVLRITAVGPTTNEITVTRSVGALAAAALLDDDQLLTIGSAEVEGGTGNAARSDNPVKVTNYTQIFKESVEMSGTQRSSDQFTKPHDWNHQLRKAGIEHAKDMEYAFLFGRKDEIGSPPVRTTGGAYEAIVTNVKDAAGTLTEAEFFDFLRPMFRYGRKEKVGFASQVAVDVLNGFPRGKLELRQADRDKTYGVRVFEYISPHGTLNIVTHYLIEALASTDKHWGEILVLDFEPIWYRFLGGGVGGSRDTHVEQNIQANDQDGRKDQYLTEAGLQFGEEKKHGLIFGITG
jgi:hypothetical protein